jgi:sugar phosphate permease
MSDVMIRGDRMVMAVSDLVLLLVGIVTATPQRAIVTMVVMIQILK